MIRFLLIPLILCFTLLPSYSFIKGRVENGIQIDYTKLNQTELETKAEFYYTSALESKTLDENMTQALNMYTMLSNMAPENISYPIKLGKLYEALGKKRYAKSYFYRAMNINESAPEPYYYLGDFYNNREQYGKALKFYLKAQEKGFSDSTALQEKINTLYTKLGA